MIKENLVQSFSEFTKKLNEQEERIFPVQWDINYDAYTEELEDYTWGKVQYYTVERHNKKYYLSYVDGKYFKSKMLLRGYFTNIYDESDEFKITITGDSGNNCSAYLDNNSRKKVDVSDIWYDFDLENSFGVLICDVYHYLINLENGRI